MARREKHAYREYVAKATPSSRDAPSGNYVTNHEGRTLGWLKRTSETRPIFEWTDFVTHMSPSGHPHCIEVRGS
jgi:hypothetical protein